MRRLVWTAVVALTVCGWDIDRAAWAGPFRFTGYDAHSIGQGGNLGAWASGLGVLYSNPALLIDVEEKFEASVFIFQPFLSARLMARPQNADIPITFYDSDVGILGTNLDRPLPTAELPQKRADNEVDSTSSYVGVGLATSLGIDRFRLGLLMLVPTDGILSLQSYFADEREQYFSNTVHFTRFGEWSRSLNLLLGMAYRPLSWWSIGVSAEGAFNLAANLDMFIPEATVQDYALVNMKLDASLAVRAVIGTTVRYQDWLSLSFTWRDRRFNKVNAVAHLALWNYHEGGDNTVPKRVIQRHVLALDYEPMELSLSAGARWHSLEGQVAVTWNRWSDFLDTHFQRAQNSAVIPSPVEGGSPINGDRFAFSDTVSITAGAGWTYLPGFIATVGLGYHPTPVPAQVGRTNYLDSDLLDVALGHRFDFCLWEKNLSVEVGLQLWRMAESTVHKDPSLIRDEFQDNAKTLISGEPMPEAQGLQTNNPGFPGFTIGGWALMGAASLTLFW